MKKMIGKLNPPGPDHIVVTRQEVARTEIVRAIRLYFDRDFVSAHLLASAATDILHALRKNAHKTTSLADLEARLREFQTPVEVSETLEFLKLAYNFFKHADGDPNAQMHFQSAFVEVSIYHAAHDYYAIFTELAPEMVVFQAWFMARHPGSFPHLPEAVQQHIKGIALAGASEAEAFAFCRDMLAKAK